MDVIYQAADKDFNFFEAQVKELDAERNQSIITSIFGTLTGTRHKIRRRQFTSIPSMPIHLGAASPIIIPSVAETPGMPVTITSPGQEALAEVPKTAPPVTTANNESQLGASYQNNHIHQVIPNNNVPVCSSDSFAQENLKTLLNERLSNKIYNTFKETFSNTNLDCVSLHI